MKEQIKDILERHYHGRNHIEERCATDILELLKNKIPKKNEELNRNSAP